MSVLPAEPIVALDDLESEQALHHPMDVATDTIAEALAFAPSTVYMAKPGHERQYMKALVDFFRSHAHYEVHELHDFKCVALVREVPEQQASTGDDGEPAAADTSRATASANVEPRQGQRDQQGSEAEASMPDREKVQAAVKEGSLEALLGLGLPPVMAEMLVHAHPDRLHLGRQLEEALSSKLESFVKAKGPVLHLHFLAVRPSEQGKGYGKAMLEHLARMADSEHKHMYLEASSEQSRQLYLRNGYTDVDKYELGGGGTGVFFWIMARAPAGKRGNAPAAEQ